MHFYWSFSSDIMAMKGLKLSKQKERKKFGEVEYELAIPFDNSAISVAEIILLFLLADCII